MPSLLVEAILGTGDTGITGDEFVAKPLRKDEIINHGNDIMQVFEHGIERWYKNGALHRDNGKPAIVDSDGSRYWYQHGLLHRAGGKPAIVRDDGKVEYWVNDARVR